MTDIIKVEAQLIQKMRYLRKHLFDNGAQNSTDVPKINPNGVKMDNIKQIANALGVDTKVAACFVIQDPKADGLLKFKATEMVRPGFYVAADDAFQPVLHQALDILNDAEYVKQKAIRIVRTASGIRRFNQPAGSIIVDDGESPLDALVAVPSDVRGYDKVVDKNKKVYYVGYEDGKWVVRDPSSNTIIYSGDNQKGAFGWLNEEVGGSAQPKQDRSENQNPGKASLGSAKYRDRRDQERSLSNIKLSKDEAHDVNKMSGKVLQYYTYLRQRGISHTQAYILAVRLSQQDGTKK